MWQMGNWWLNEISPFVRNGDKLPGLAKGDFSVMPRSIYIKNGGQWFIKKFLRILLRIYSKKDTIVRTELERRGRRRKWMRRPF